MVGRGAWRLLVAAALAGQACAGRSAGVKPQGASVAALEVERVAQILERHHPSHAPLDATTARRAYAKVLDTVDPAGSCTARRGALVNDGEGIARALRAGDFAFAVEVVRVCTGTLITSDAARTLALGAVAAAYDPFCRYLDPRALAARRAQAHGQAGAVARGRLLERDGMRVAWLELPSFYLSTERSASGDALFIARELQARGADLLVLDLRGNGGGVVAEAERLAAALLGGGALAFERDAAGRVRVLESGAREQAWSGPLVVLIDRRTGSMAELFAAAVQDRGRALLAGERSYGKGLATTLVLLSSPLGTALGAVEVSERAFYRLDGRVLQGAGVTPDVELAPDPGGSSRTPAFIAPWLPARIEPDAAVGVVQLDSRALGVAREAAQASKGDLVERALAVALAYARAAHTAHARP